MASPLVRRQHPSQAWKASIHVVFQSESVRRFAPSAQGINTYTYNIYTLRPPVSHGLGNSGRACFVSHVVGRFILDVCRISTASCASCPQVSRFNSLVLTMIGNVGSACEEDATLEEFTSGCNATVGASQVLPLASILHLVFNNDSTSLSSSPSLDPSSTEFLRNMGSSA